MQRAFESPPTQLTVHQAAGVGAVLRRRAAEGGHITAAAVGLRLGSVTMRA
jgi:hypothetical protein